MPPRADHETDAEVAAFVEAACVPLQGSHASGTLDAANALLATQPALPRRSIHVAAILGDDVALRAQLAADSSAATTKGGPRHWDPLTHLCFSRYLRLDRRRAAGFLRAARALLEAGADANTGWFETAHQPRPVWESALYGVAGIAHDAALTRLLLEHGADPNDEETPYHAPESYDHATLLALLESGRLTADSLATMLLRKADWHDTDGIVTLLKHGADPNRPTIWGCTALHAAVRRDNALENIAAMLDHGAAPGITTAPSASPHAPARSAVALAARRGRSDLLTLFEQRGFPLELAGVERLIAACARDDAAAIATLAGGNDSRLREELLGEGATLLAEFAGVGNTAGVRRLLELGVQVDARYGGDEYYGIAKGSTALHVAAWRIRPSTVELLIARGAAVDARDDAGRTPLMLAVRACVESYWAERRTPGCVAALLAAGASPRGIAVPCGYAPVDDLLRRHAE